MEALLVLFLLWCMSVFLNAKAKEFEAIEKRAREEGRKSPGKRLEYVKPRESDEW